jgi:transcriptional regulator
MHIPKLYREEDREKIVAFLKQNNFPALVSFDGERPVATHLPVEVVEHKDGLTLYGHMSRANPQWKHLDGQEVLFIFQGAHTYISPLWYNHVNVPTWNYQIVHVYGKVRELQGDDLFGLLSRLVKTHEPSSTYRLEELPPDFVQKEMKGVFGFAMEVTRLDAGYKLSQNRNDEDHANIVTRLNQREDEDSKQVAEAMRQQRGG